MLFNWVQPLFNRYAQGCAKGVTRVGMLNYFFSCLVRARHKTRSGVSLLSFNFRILISVGLNLRDREFVWFGTHTI